MIMDVQRGINEVRALLADQLKAYATPDADVAAGMVDRRVGGLYRMGLVADAECEEHSSPALFEYSNRGYISIPAGLTFSPVVASARLFPGPIVDQTNATDVRLSVTGQGRVSVQLDLVDEDKSEPCQRWVGDLAAGACQVVLPIAELPIGRSLAFSISSMGEGVKISEAEWSLVGPVGVVNNSIRLVMLRTFGLGHVVSNRLNTVISELSRRAPDVLSRHYFVVYDADPAVPKVAVGHSSPGVLTIEGPNLGGGGNASLMLSIAQGALMSAGMDESEILILDDDGVWDAETLIRNDGRVSFRGKPVISTALVMDQRRPHIVQESGGYWGKHLNVQGNLQLAQDAEVASLFPYLNKAGLDLREGWAVSRLARGYSVDFSTFIFISFPLEVAKLVGGIRPFFLRNDDVDFCLRAQRQGIPIVVNANIRVWHVPSQPPLGLFFAILHGVVMNNGNGSWFSRGGLQVLLKLIEQAGSCRNPLTLGAVAEALEAYVQGPTWMMCNEYPEQYLAVRLRLNGIRAEYLESVPFEVVEPLIQASMALSMPLAEFGSNNSGLPVVFMDEGGGYSQLKQDVQPNDVGDLSLRCVSALAACAKDESRLGRDWADALEPDVGEFWINLCHEREIQFVVREPCASLSGEQPGVAEAQQGRRRVVARAKQATLEADLSSPGVYEAVPPWFSSHRYLELNPDVKESGVDPSDHFVAQGRFEKRKF